MPEGFIVGIFSDPRALERACAATRRARYRIHDVFAPHPVHGLDEAMGQRKTRLPLVTLFAGLGGLTLAALLQFYANVLDWPLDVGGKPDNSTLAFVPIAFELTVLSAALATVFAFFVRARLYPGKATALASSGVTDDTFVLVLQRPDNFFDTRRASLMLEGYGATSVEEREMLW